MSSKLREAVSRLVREIEDGMLVELSSKFEHDLAKSLLADVKSALSEPLRNCDVGSVVEQRNRFVEYCKGHRIKITGNADVCNPKCPCIKYGDFNLCVLVWSQMPYEEGGAK